MKKFTVLFVVMLFCGFFVPYANSQDVVYVLDSSEIPKPKEIKYVIIPDSILSFFVEDKEEINGEYVCRLYDSKERENQWRAWRGEEIILETSGFSRFYGWGNLKRKEYKNNTILFNPSPKNGEQNQIKKIIEIVDEGSYLWIRTLISGILIAFCLSVIVVRGFLEKSNLDKDTDIFCLLFSIIGIVILVSTPQIIDNVWRFWKVLVLIAIMLFLFFIRNRYNNKTYDAIVFSMPVIVLTGIEIWQQNNWYPGIFFVTSIAVLIVFNACLVIYYYGYKIRKTKKIPQ